MAYTNRDTVINAVTSTTTSAGYDVSMREKLSLQFVTSGVSGGGSATYTVDVSDDNVNWVAYNRLTTNVTNTNAQTDTRVASVAQSSNTTAIVFFPIGDYFQFIRVTATVVATATATAILAAYSGTN